MALLSKKPAPTEFRVPSLAEVDPEYAGLLQKQADVQAEQAALRKEIKALEHDIDTRKAPRVRAGVASILGEAVDLSLNERPARLREMRQRFSDLEAASVILSKRISDQRTRASLKVCAAAQSEFEAHKAAIAKALEAVQAARLGYVNLINQFEAEDVQWTSLGPLTLGFLGDVRDGHVQRFLREAVHAV